VIAADLADHKVKKISRRCEKNHVELRFTPTRPCANASDADGPSYAPNAAAGRPGQRPRH